MSDPTVRGARLEALHFREALRVHSRLRWPRWLGPGDRAASEVPGSPRRHFPAVGMIVASLSAIAYAACALFLPHGVAVLVAMSVGLWLTSARHEQALARFADTPLGRSAPAAEPAPPASLAVAGGVVLVLALVGRLEMLVSLDPSWVGVTLVSAAMFSRACASVFAADPAATGGRHAAVAAFEGGLPTLLAAFWTGEHAAFALAALLAIVAALLIRRGLWWRRAIGETDALGAIQVAAELAFVLGMLAVLVAGVPPTMPDGGPIPPNE